MPLVVLEGIDGSGKSSTALELYAAMTKAFGEQKVLAPVHPFSTQVGSWVKRIMESGVYKDTPTEYHLVVSAHADTWRSYLITAMQVGKWCILDRGLMSLMTYQRQCFPLESDEDFARKTFQDYSRYARHFAFMSHTIKLFLDVDVHIALERIAQRSTSDKLDGDVRRLGQLAQQYEISAIEYTRASGNPVVRIGANGDLHSVTRACLKEISRRFFGDADELLRGNK